jgi:hypothetical protein
MHTRHALLLALAAALVVPGCGTADVAGDYSISITNRENGCNFDNWTEGDTATGISLSITQDGSDVTGTVGGLTGQFLNLWLGSATYTGTVSGDDVEMTLYGERSFNEGNCSFTFNSTIVADSNGDVLTGDVLYRAATNGNPDCAALEGCVTRQQFNGTRPPQ